MIRLKLLLKYAFVLLFLIVGLSGCKKRSPVTEAEPQPEMPAVITGKLFGQDFSAKLNLERYTNFSMGNYRAQDLFAIYVAADASRSCSSAVEEFAMRLTVPKKVGTFSGGDTYVLANDPQDPKGQSGALFSSTQTIITITAISSDVVSGYVDIKSTKYNIDLKGRFTATICK